MSLIVVKPISVTDAMLISCDVPETDYAEYNPASTYAQATRVKVTSSHLVYESALAGNIGNTPATNPTKWFKVGATNPWKCLDTKTSTQTVQAGGMSYRFRPGQVVNVLGVLNAFADSVRIRMIDPVQGTVYDKTTSLLGSIRRPSWHVWFFSRRMRKSQVLALDLPSYYGADILVDVTVASGDARLGVLMFGYQQALGEGVELGAGVGISDYSRQVTNTWGDTELEPLAWAKRASFAMKVKNTEIDELMQQLVELRSTACLWIGTDRYACTVVFGWCGVFDILISYQTYSDCSTDIKGLT
ncbi:MAG: carbohydrate-binding protein [Rhodoferax sp.]